MSKPKKLGRPTKYKASYCEELIEYFDQPLYIKVPVEKMSASGAVKVIEERVANDMPTFEGFARKIGTIHETLLNWSKQHEAFFDAYCVAKGIQKQFIFTHSLGNKYNTNFAKFFAINNLGMKESSHLTTENEHKVEGYGLAFDLTKKPDEDN